MNVITDNLNKLKLEPNSDEYLRLDKELALAKNDLNILIPNVYKDKKRQRRGLINVLGSGLKLIAGTMDYEDAKDIEQHLRMIDRNSEQITRETNKQVIINNNLARNYKQIVDHVNTQQQKLNTFLNELNTRSNSTLLTLLKIKINFPNLR